MKSSDEKAYEAGDACRHDMRAGDGPDSSGAGDTGSCASCCGTKRSFLKGAGLISLGLLASRVAPTFAAAVGYGPKTQGLPVPGDRLAAGGTTAPVKALTVDDIPEAESESNPLPLLAFPFDPETKKVRGDNRFNGVMLGTFKESALNAGMKKAAVLGVLAYSHICVHQGCVIGGYDQDSKTYFCPCHGSRFYPLQDGEVASGPALRPLPNLPLKLASDGQTLVVADYFNAPIGPIRY